MNRQEKLIRVVTGNSDVEDLQDTISEIDELLDILDRKINRFEKLGLVEQMNSLCDDYVDLCLEKVDYEIKLCKLKLEQLGIEKELLEELN